MQDDPEDKRAEGSPDRPAPRSAESVPGPETMPSPVYRWGGYPQGDLEIEAGYITPEGYGPYATPEAAAVGQSVGQSVPDAARGEGPQGNHALGENVREALLREGRLSGSRLAIEVAGGVVVLKGRAPSEFLRRLAQDVATAVPGVLVVHNHMDVADMGPGTGDGVPPAS